MRYFLGFAVLVACGGDDAPAADASAADAAVDALSIDAEPDAAIDAPIDAPPCPTPLLVGGTDVAAQGWAVVMSGNATLTYGADYTRLETTTTTGGSTGGHLLLTHPSLAPAGTAFAVTFELMVERVDNHNQADAAVGLLGAFTPTFGLPAERQQMVYIDGARVGWADNTQTFTANALDGAYHSYLLAVDAADTATLSIDGVPALTRANFTRSASFALGDQTNDPNVDSAFRIRSVSIPCPN